MTTQRPVFVLVPGAYHLPSSWDVLRGELDSLGYASRAVKLRTSGPDPRGDMHDDARAVRSAIEAIGGPVVVVAHSYSGIPVTEGAAVPGVLARPAELAALLDEIARS